MQTRKLIPIYLVVLALAWTPVYANTARPQDWPHFRGPNYDLTSLDNGALEGDGFGLAVVWKKPLGSAYSSISVVGDRAVTMFADGEHDHLVALDAATGKELWRYTFGEMYAGHDGSDDGPLSTPTIHDGTVYALGARGQLVAVALADGKPRWKKQLIEELGARAPFYGFTTTPLVVDDMLIVQTGGEEGRAVTALDLGTGAVKWSSESDAVGYQNPLLADFGGERQILAVSSHHLYGLEPATGKALWKHLYSEQAQDGAQPVLVGDDRILLAQRREAVLYRVAKNDGAYGVEEVWRSRGLRNNSVVPIVWKDHVYGYAGNFLTSLDLETGETTWKSRPPGYGGLALVDGHLVTLAGDGEVVIAAASPEGYREKARLTVTESDSLTPPSFANGRIFVRDLEQIAALSITAEAAAPRAESAPAIPADALHGDFGKMVERAMTSKKPQEVVDGYLEKKGQGPIHEGDGLVHFVYRGEVPDLVIWGTWLPLQDEAPMHHIPGTDVYFRSEKLDPEATYEYGFAVFEEQMSDPANPDVIETAVAPEASILRMPGWQEPAYLAAPEGAGGKLETFTWKSDSLENEREVSVYLPAAYGKGDDRYPLLVAHYGDQALSQGKMQHALDNLIGKSMAPVVVAFVPRAGPGEYGGPTMEAYVDALAKELIPTLEERYRLAEGAAHRAIIGPGSSGVTGAWAALHRPDLFGKVATQSFYSTNAAAEAVYEAVEKAENKPSFVVAMSEHDYKGPRMDSRADAERLVELLREKGYDVQVANTRASVGWSGWRTQYGDVLAALFPLSR